MEIAKNFNQLMLERDYFPGEEDAIHKEFLGSWGAAALLTLPKLKRERLTRWLNYPKAQRQAAFEKAQDWAMAPIAGALDMLANPEKYASREKKATGGVDAAIAAFLEDDG